MTERTGTERAGDCRAGLKQFRDMPMATSGTAEMKGSLQGPVLAPA